jgi:hypothetical protein
MVHLIVASLSKSSGLNTEGSRMFKFVRDAIGWGFMLWLFGYILGFVFYFLVPPQYLGWAIMPFGIALIVWVLFKKVEPSSLTTGLSLAIFWTVIAIVFDFLFIVKLLRPVDGYYKLDVYLYYVLTFFLPLAALTWRKSKPNHTTVES